MKILNKIKSFFSRTFVYRVEEGALLKPFYKVVYYDVGSYTKVCMPIGIHLLAKLYLYLAYHNVKVEKRLKMVTIEEWNKHWQDGVEYGMLIIQNAGKKKSKLKSK